MSGSGIASEPPDPYIDFSSLGPNVGQQFPEIALPDQTGRIVKLHELRNYRQAVIVFFRSADW